MFYGITGNLLYAQLAGLDYAQSGRRELLAHAKAQGAQEMHLQAFGDPNTVVESVIVIIKTAHKEEITIMIKILLMRPAITEFPNLKALVRKIFIIACYHAVMPQFNRVQE